MVNVSLNCWQPNIPDRQRSSYRRHLGFSVELKHKHRPGLAIWVHNTAISIPSTRINSLRCRRRCCCKPTAHCNKSGEAIDYTEEPPTPSMLRQALRRLENNSTCMSTRSIYQWANTIYEIAIALRLQTSVLQLNKNCKRMTAWLFNRTNLMQFGSKTTLVHQYLMSNVLD